MSSGDHTGSGYDARRRSTALLRTGWSGELVECPRVLSPTDEPTRYPLGRRRLARAEHPLDQDQARTHRSSLRRG